ncbi:hypothetical protein CCP3SC1AL1_360012 [Gammaproteobacteria bacterium]
MSTSLEYALTRGEFLEPRFIKLPAGTGWWFLGQRRPPHSCGAPLLNEEGSYKIN